MRCQVIVRMFWIAAGLFLSFQCNPGDSTKLTLNKEQFGKTPDGKQVDLYTLANQNGMVVKVMNYGGIITAIEVPDKAGKVADVVLGYDHLEGYVAKNNYFGSVVGRYGNRIAKGQFILDGQTCQLATNNGPNHLHGGPKGYACVVWDAEPITAEESVGVKFTYLSPDGEEGYPGNLKITMVYSLNPENELSLCYKATTDKATPVNLTNHSYFNLKDAGASPILDHELMIDADSITPVDGTLIPTGEFMSVENTPFDFRTKTKIGSRIDEDNIQLKYGNGYDHNWVLNGSGGDLRKVAELSESTTSRLMEVWTTEPGIQFYSGNFLDGSVTGKNNHIYKFRHGLCLETQHFPDSPNQPNFPSTILRPGETYHTQTIYKFKTL